MKQLQTKRPPRIQVLKTEHEYHIYYADENTSTYSVGIHISWGALFWAVACLLLLGFLFESQGSKNPASNQSSSTEASGVPDSASLADPIAHGLETEGFVFSDSDSRLLTDADISALMTSDTYTVQELLRFAVNEIYARNGYEFSTKFYREFYRQFDWYEGGYSAEQAVFAFTDCERKNVDFLLSVENQYSP